MIYAVAGVSGNTGKVAAETLLAAGKTVRVIVRDAAKGESWKARGAEVAVADLNNAQALSNALKGAAAAYLLVPPNMTADDPAAEQRVVIKALGEAIRSSAIAHVVFLSSVGAQHPAGTGPIAALNVAEKDFSTITSTSFTFLRAAYFMENIGGSLAMLGQGLLPSFIPAGFTFPMVATKDIGQQAAKLLVEGPSGHTRVVELFSANHNMNDVAKVLSDIVGKPINVAEAPVSAMASTLQGFGFKPKMAAMYEEMTGAMISGHVGFEGTSRVQGTTTLDAVLRPMVSK